MWIINFGSDSRTQYINNFGIRMVFSLKINNVVLVADSRGLRSRARYQTRQDWMRLETIPELPGPGRDYFFMVPLLGKIWEKFGKNSGRDGTTWYHLGKVLDGLEMNWNPRVFPKFSTEQEIFCPVLEFKKKQDQPRIFKKTRPLTPFLKERATRNTEINT